MKMKKIAIFASGSGTNADNITRFFHEGNRLRVDILLTDRENIPVIEKLQNLGVETVCFPRKTWRENPEMIVDFLRQRDVDLLVLAGFNTILQPAFIQAFPKRILNIHPSLLPKFGGEGMWGGNVHKAVLEAGETKSGPTVHYVSEDVDAGEILMQQEVDVLPDDTAESLEERVHEAEYVLYPRAIVEALRRLDNPVTKKIFTPDSPADEQPPSYSSPMNSEPQVENEAEATPPPIPHFVSNQNCASQSSEQPRPMPPTYLIWSLLVTLACCFIPGIIAIIYSSRVTSQYFSGDYEGAERSSRLAEIWIIASFCLGVLSATVYMPLMMLMN